MYYALLWFYSRGVPMAKTAILVGIINIIMIQNVHGALRGKLEVKGSATDLADKDGWTAGQSDPYMEVVAVPMEGNDQTLTTPVRGGTNNPTWNDYLVFKSSTWLALEIVVMDYDGAGREPDPLCGPSIIVLKSGEHTRSFNCYPGQLTVQYKFSTTN